MTKKLYGSVSAIAFAALIAGGFTVLPSFSGQVVASAPIQSDRTNLASAVRETKGDRLDIRPLGQSCSEQAWPYFEASCLRDSRSAQGHAKPARIVAADNISR